MSQNPRTDTAEDDLFLIAAGGGGAKVVEALIHLAAAGLCPNHVCVLLVDGDAANGNRKRTVGTWESYRAIQGWPWRVKPSITSDKPNASEIRLFQTDLRLFTLAEPFSPAEAGSLRPLVQDDIELHDALSVVLDDREMEMNMGVGFTGRPNLGCLVMGAYLQHHLRAHAEARQFIQRIENSARKGGAHRPTVAVVGSVFGGTGASMLPVARAVIKGVFDEPDANGNPRQQLYQTLRWGKVMQLPYFRPDSGRGLEVVNPARHFVDTSGALWYYGLAQGQVEPTYLIGSDSPEYRLTEPVSGGMKQNNPAFYHELLAALAVLDLHRNTDGEALPIRHYSNTGANEAAREANSLAELPAPRNLSQRDVRRQLALLLHLAAFSLDWREPASPEFHQGLFQYAKGARLTGWTDVVHRKWREERQELHDQGGSGERVLEYFARLMLWSRTVLSSAEYHSSGLDYESNPGLYASLHNTLCEIAVEEIEVAEHGQFPRDKDTLAACLCRLALAGLAREDADASKAPDEAGPEGRDAVDPHRDFRGHQLALKPNPLVQQQRMIRVGMKPGALASSLVRHGLDEERQVRAWFAEFRVPLPDQTT